MIARLAAVVREATASFEAYDYARALQHTEELFWWFCDFYLELVKGRRYDARRRSRRRRLGQPRAAPVRVDLPATVRPVPAVRVRGGLVVVAGRLDPSRALARRRRAGRRAAGAPASDREGRRNAQNGREEDEALAVTAEVLQRGAQGQVPGAAADARARAPGARARHRPSVCAALELGEGDLLQAGAIEQLETGRVRGARRRGRAGGGRHELRLARAPRRITSRNRRPDRVSA